MLGLFSNMAKTTKQRSRKKKGFKEEEKMKQKGERRRKGKK